MKRHDVSRFTEKEKKIIEKMTKDTKERFFRLSSYDKKKIFKSAEKVIREEQILDRQKKWQKKKKHSRLFTGKIRKTVRGVKKAYDAASVAARIIGIFLQAPDVVSNKPQPDEEVDLFMKTTEVYQKGAEKTGTAVRLSAKGIRKGVQGIQAIQARKNAVSNGLNGSPAAESGRRMSRKKFRIKKGKQPISAGKKSGAAVKKVFTALRNLIKPANSIWLAAAGILLIVLLGAFLMMVVPVVLMGPASSGEEDGQYQAEVSEKTESYRTLVEEYCEKYGIDDYVDLCLAVIEQESGGNPPDVMQAEQSYYNNNPPIDDAEESIDCGVHEISDCLKAASVSGSGDIKNIKLALQGYNFGNGYIDWALKKDGGYTEKNAKEFSKKMCDELGYSSYGDVEYVPHVLRYYVANEKITVSSEEAAALLEELKSNNTAPAGAWKVIETGASLIGSVTYSMEERQDDGRDHPTVLDCSSFTAWSFHKAGYTNISYTMVTTNFVSSNRFVTITADELQPGDIGLKSETAPAGGSNHVGIYCGKLKDGTKVWMHCTSSSSTSLTGNDSGAMMGSYTNFTFFRRLKKFNQ